ncbi:Lipoteichoic acid synthase-like [Acididesulfobacillus acetoxydans]|uniref:Lipoteichoic acid synthase-like n=1 Tax=Acididesulfobacillus acetoxydans TaxID=1561005 RepID=A0A8S0XAS1_9FIRM|nr:LTA synthase family protein [Acididesulfobacillus acetoxydans]CAA7600296.1 Lipoteichoic acid synthase-like [Acididesulfobacillus acetoxydans]CEJ06072.1 Lipoteichoic acid synthase-like YvgJ [Acididesulfobacillus acetoxydans]
MSFARPLSAKSNKPTPFILGALAFVLFLTKIYVVLSAFGLITRLQAQSRFFGTAGVLLILCSVAFLLKGRGRGLYLLAADLLVTVVSFFDLLFLRHFDDIITLCTFVTAWQDLTGTTAWWSLLRPQDIFLIVDFFFLVPAALRFRSSREPAAHPADSRPSSKHRALFYRAGGFVLALGLGLLALNRASTMLEKDQPGIARTLYSKLYIAQSIGNLDFHVLDARRAWQIRLHTPPLTPQKGLALQQWFKATHPPSQHNNVPPALGVAKGKNLIIIQVESLQQFVIGKKIDGKEITPNLNRLIKNSYYFDHYYGETWNGGTADAEFMANVSQYPVSKGSAFIDYPMNHYTSIGSTFAAAGYTTTAIEANLPGFWGMDLMAPALGFQQVMDSDDFKPGRNIGLGLADPDMFQQGAARLEQLKQPFYSFFVTLSSHYPFELPPKDRTLQVAPYRHTLFGHYLQAVHYTDQAIGSFLDRLQKDGLLANSVVVIYGDHPAPLPRHDTQLSSFLGYGAKGIDDYHWQEMQKIPLIIHLPVGVDHGIEHTVGGPVDLFPTLLGLFGQDASHYPLIGHDLFHSPLAGLAISRNGVVYEKGKLYNVYGRTVYQMGTGKVLPWSDSNPALKLYNTYLNNTDLIFQHDLQQKLLHAP